LLPTFNHGVRRPAAWAGPLQTARQRAAERRVLQRVGALRARVGGAQAGSPGPEPPRLGPGPSRRSSRSRSRTAALGPPQGARRAARGHAEQLASFLSAL